VEIGHAVSAARAAARLYSADESAALLAGFSHADGVQPPIELRRETTLGAILRLAAGGHGRIGVLNFASAKNPGGGFINGAMAQEESLAIASDLYNTQLAQPDYYVANRANRSMMYTNYAIYSPGVTFFRDDAGALLTQPVQASILTLPAVNMGQVRAHGEDEQAANLAMEERMKLSLAIFADQGAQTLILGAYGCGVFANDPVWVATRWRTLLSAYSAHFNHITMSIRDGSRDHACYKAFARTFG
jgi:uncharacterized protein (TIGR02452 family)